jgi:membrane protein YqaA with SNARE-associated domain
LWGFAEATLFFLVPDVYLSRLALTGLRKAAAGCLLATAGALAGGALMHGWAAHEPAAAEAAVDRVPAVSRAALARVARQIEERGPAAAVLLGGVSGTPYKIYAVEAGRLGVGNGRFLLASAPARLCRFLAVSLLAAGLARLPALARRPGLARRLHAGAWTAFYIAYLSLVPW